MNRLSLRRRAPAHSPDQRLRIRPRPNPTRPQRGAALLFALLTLVAMLLATLALVRSVDTNAQLSGNVAFKLDATAAGDQATRSAIAWLEANGSKVLSDVPASGYYASIRELDADGTTPLPPTDVTGTQLPSTTDRQLVDWDGDRCASLQKTSASTCVLQPAAVAAINGNTAAYVIFRMCSVAGDPIGNPGVLCTKPVNSTSAGAANKGSLSYAVPKPPTDDDGIFYRIVVRVKGARNTTSFVETIVNI